MPCVSCRPLGFKPFFLLCAAVCAAVLGVAIYAAPVWALGKMSMQDGKPIEVTATRELEWDRDGKTYIARGSAKAVQGENSLEGDVLKAYYSDGSGAASVGGQSVTNTKINRIEAFGHVVIKSDGNTAYGDQGVYDLTTGEAVLTGGNLILATAQETITARDRITFNSMTNIMTAQGKARLEHLDDVLESDRLVATFHEVAGRLELKEMEAIGHVVITTPAEVLTGDRARFVAATNIATIDGNVTIRRDNNVLTGARGQVNLTTRKSRLFGGEGAPVTGTTGGDSAGQPDASQGTGGKQRVRGVFYPE